MKETGTILKLTGPERELVCKLVKMALTSPLTQFRGLDYSTIRKVFDKLGSMRKSKRWKPVTGPLSKREYVPRREKNEKSK